jgi:DNA-binding FadR family transcriptional regulator
VQELREEVELLAVELATQRATAQDITQLRSMAGSLRSATDADTQVTKLVEFHIRLAQLAGNSAIEIFTRVLLGLAVVLRPAARADLEQVLSLGLAQLVDAIELRDWPLARRTLMMHLRDAAAQLL